MTKVLPWEIIVPRPLTAEEIANRQKREAESRERSRREMAEKRARLLEQSVVKLVPLRPSFWQRVREIFRAIRQG